MSHDHDDITMSAEHSQLYHMMSRLEPVIMEDGRRAETVHKALVMLRERMAEHFQLEEDLFATADWQSRQILRDDHRCLLDMLDQLTKLPPTEADARKHGFRLFLEALNRHDYEVDGPLMHYPH